MALGNLKLTPNFKLGEFVRAEDPMPPAFIIDNIERLAERLQAVRDIINMPIVITSGYRTKEHNKAVGGAESSLHLEGLAADVVVKGMTPGELQELLSGWSGGMGSYDTWTHLDIRKQPARW